MVVLKATTHASKKYIFIVHSQCVKSDCSQYCSDKTNTCVNHTTLKVCLFYIESRTVPKTLDLKSPTKYLQRNFHRFPFGSLVLPNFPELIVHSA